MMKHCYLIYLFIKMWRWLCITFNFNHSMEYFFPIGSFTSIYTRHSLRHSTNQTFSEGIFHHTEYESDHQQYLNFNKLHTIVRWDLWESIFYFSSPFWKRSWNDPAVQSSNQKKLIWNVIYSSDLLSFLQISLLV